MQQGQQDHHGDSSGQVAGTLRTGDADVHSGQHQPGAPAMPRQQQQQGGRQSSTAEGMRNQRSQAGQDQQQEQGSQQRRDQGQQVGPASPGDVGPTMQQLAAENQSLTAEVACLKASVVTLQAEQVKQQQEISSMQATLQLLLQDKPQQQGAAGSRSGRRQQTSRQHQPQAAAVDSNEGGQPTEVYPPPPEGDPPPADSGQLQHRVQELEAKVQRAVDQLPVLGALSAKLEAAGISSVEAGAALKNAANQGAEAHMKQEALSDRVGAAEGEIRALKDQQQQQTSHLQAVERTRQGRIVVHAPTELQPQEIIRQVGTAAGVSLSSILGAQLVGRNAVPAPPAAPRDGSAPAAGNGSGSSSGAASDRQQQAAAGNGAAGSSSSGADGSAGRRADGAAIGSYAAAVGIAQGDAAGGGGRRRMATYLLLVSTSALEPRLLGGYTRRNLKAANTRIYVEKPLTQDEMAQRQQLMPLRRKLMLKDCKTRWRGAVLEEQVGRGNRRRWVNAVTHGSESQHWQQQQREREQSPQGHQGQQQQQRRRSPVRPGGDAAAVRSRQ